jgi:hypothetical protein
MLKPLADGRHAVVIAMTKHQTLRRRPDASIAVAPPDNSEIAARWLAQYRRGGVWRGCDGGIEKSKQIYAGLLALGANPSSADIERIIGNDSWTT